MFNGVSQFYNGVTSSSLRANIGDSPGLRRTMLAGTSRRKFTFSAWVKRAGTFAATENFFAVTAGEPDCQFGFRSSGDGGGLQFSHYTGGFDWRVETTAKFRDVSAWYHLVARVDTTQGTNSNRVRLYVNGVVQTALAQNTYPDQNFDTVIGVADQRMYLAGGKSDEGGGNVYSDSYITEINFIDGQSLAPTSFGESKNGVWIPIDTSGLTFGNNGTRLQFKNSGTATTGQGTTATTNIGDDSSGNGHNFQTLGYVASDVVPDSPENNFCTFNPLSHGVATTFSEGNLKTSFASNSQAGTTSTMYNKTGKWYWEVAPLTQYVLIGASTEAYSSGNVIVPSGSRSYYGDSGQKYLAGTASSYGDSYGDNDIIGIALNMDDQEITFYKNNTAQASGAAIALESGIAYAPVIASAGSGGTYQVIANFGQDSSFGGNETAQGNKDGNGNGDFYYEPPSGFLALCTANFPEPTIGPNSLTQSTDNFQTVTWTGNASNDLDVDANFNPDWLWIKMRGNTADHALYDSNRGNGVQLISNSAAADATNNTNGSRLTQADGGIGFEPGSIRGYKFK